MAINACSQTAEVFAGSTPCDPLVRSWLKIPGNDCEFIRWKLVLEKGENNFKLDIAFGATQPNTNGFKNGGGKNSITGTYTVSNGHVYHLRPQGSPPISFSRLNNDLLHLLNTQQDLMTGNGGWSYTLSRKDPGPRGGSSLPSAGPSSFFTNDTVTQVRFDGRTPCKEIAAEYNLPVRDDCYKLKWSIILRKDPVTRQPSTYTLKWTLSRTTDIEGKWSIVKGTDPNVIMFKLDNGKPGESFYFLVGDENVIFLMDKQKRLLAGDGNFSYTLNKMAR